MRGALLAGTFSILAIACVAPAPQDDSYIWAHASSGEQTPIAADAGLAEAGESDVTFDDESVLGVVAAQGYASFGRFSVPFSSAGAPGVLVEEWVSANAVEVYDAIVPDAGGGSDVVMPVGSILVRAVVDDGGTVAKLTLMAKGPRGYNPALGDWWFGVTDPTGIPLETDGGALVGKLDACYGCHLPQRASDFLFGVPLQDRTPSQ